MAHASVVRDLSACWRRPPVSGDDHTNEFTRSCLGNGIECSGLKSRSAFCCLLRLVTDPHAIAHNSKRAISVGNMFYCFVPLAVSVKAKGDRLSMSTKPLARCEVRRRVARIERARVRCSWPIGGIALCFACGGGAAVEHSADDGASSSASSANDPSWCEIQAIFQGKCQRCHHTPLEHGAPFPLLTYGDTQARDGKDKARFEQIADAVDTQYMPPQFIALEPPVALLTADERTMLLAWCSQGAPLVGSATCSADP